VLERALLLINTPYTYFTILCAELAAASMGFAATVCMHGSTATQPVRWSDLTLLAEKIAPGPVSFSQQ
jgi:hypothetical protein